MVDRGREREGEGGEREKERVRERERGGGGRRERKRERDLEDKMDNVLCFFMVGQNCTVFSGGQSHCHLSRTAEDGEV